MPFLPRPRVTTTIWTTCLLTIILAATIAASAVEMRPHPPGQPGVTTEMADGAEAYAVTAAPDSRPQARFASNEKLATGWHRLDAEYRTTGLGRMDQLEAKVCPPDYRTWHSAFGRIASATDWARIVVFFNVSEPTPALFELKASPDSPAGAAVLLRNLVVTPYHQAQGTNLAPNVDFARGTDAGFPDGWSWQFHGFDGAYERIAAEGLGSGARAVRLTPGGEKAVCTLQGVDLPLPTDGTISFTVWARTSSPGMTLRLFLLGDKYQWNVSKDFLPTESWMKFTVSGDCPAATASPFFWPRIDATGPGALEVVGESVVWHATPTTPSPEWVAPVGKNLLVNPGFDFGMNGWYLDTFDPKNAAGYAKLNNGSARIVADADPHQGPALLLSPASPSLVAFCVPTQLDQTFSFSASVRATAPESRIKMFMIDTNWHFVAKEFGPLPANEWMRCEWPLTWNQKSKGRRVYARIDVVGDAPVFIDDVQLELGEQPTPYAPQPVSIGLVADMTNVYDQGSTAVPTLRVIPASPLPGEVNVEMVAHDAWGRQVFREHVKAPGNRRTNLPVELPTDTLGNFHVTLTATTADGTIVGKARWRFAVIPPIPDTAAPGAYPMGINYELHGEPEAMVGPDAELMKRIGVGLNRFFLGHVADPRHADAPILDAVRRKAAILRAAGIESILCHNQAPESIKEKFHGLEDFDEASLREYADFLRPFVESMKGELRQWEVLNEPNLWRVGAGPDQGKPTMPPKKYMAVLKTAYAVIKAVDPTLVVHAPCLNGIDTDYLKELMALGMAKYMDVFSFHPYRTSPDLPDTYADLLRLRAILDEGGFSGPMINTEQYFGCDRFEFHGSDAETSRGYYLRGNEELPTAGRTVRNYIHHAAAGIPYCAFAPNSTLFTTGGYDLNYTFDLLPAYAAAANFLSRAGLGHPLQAGTAMRAFLFPKAEGGPLMALYAPETSFRGTISMPGDYAAFDIMGNPLPANAPLPLAGDPIYLRFPAATREGDIATALSRAELSGMGDPFVVSTALTAERRLTVSVLNTLNHPASGTVSLTRLPDGWRQPDRKAEFTQLAPGQTGRFDFDIAAAEIKPLANYPVEATVESAGRVVKTTTKISPVFARRMAAVTADALLDEWRDAAWMDLGEDHLSADFNPDLPHTGAKDLAAQFACGWGDDFLAIVVRVEDDTFVPPDSPLQAYTADSLQLYFDPQNDATATTSGYAPDDIAYSISSVGGDAFAYLEKGSEQRYIGEANRSTGLDSEVQAAVRRDGTTTTYEIVFPAKVLPGAELAPGKGFGFSMLINDNDGKGRKMGLTLAPKGSEPYNAPALFKKLILVDPAGAPNPPANVIE